MKIINNHLFLIIAIFLSIFALIPLIHPGFFPIHDDEQIGRLFELNQALRQGQFPVRIDQNLGFGYGYLLFNYYPPFIYYFAEIFKLLGFSFINSIKLMIISGFFLSSLFMYLFGRELFGKIGGLLASVFYIYVPYRAVDLYVRGALPELFSFAFIPAIFWFYLRLSRTLEFRYLLLASLFNFLLIITHNLIALMFIPFALIFLIYLLLKSKKRKIFINQVLLSFFLAFLLSAFFAIPALLENKHTMVSLLTKELASYSHHFVYLRQFIDSPWGYGGSIYGLKDGLSFEAGKLHILGVIISLALVLYSYLAKKKGEILIFLFIFLFGLSIFLQSFYSKPIWDNVFVLSYIQFPWRFLLFSAFFSSILTASIVYFLKNNKLIKILTVFLIIGVLILNINFFKPRIYLDTFNDSNYISQDILRWETSKMAFEYVPKGIAIKKSDIGNTIVDIEKNEIAKKSFEVVSGKMQIMVKKDFANLKEFKINIEEKGEFRINSFAYPGWEVFVDNRPINYNSNNKLKLISFRLNSGNHTIMAIFKDTQVRKISNLLSFIGVILFIGFFSLYILKPAYLKKFNLTK
ncbi:MAG: hypothetical protein US02_C0005G0004 [Candidatus Levybacteria bacterium GW2011_GWA2_36_13]|nr:MAG: hypothetical protein US02_C0005G0004 [Candidatus Levybacteria bacterium GW2011_GWA2_36_13]KKQ00634.1 MAG: hypothetical protein US07_C0009G0011 [Candidatus Levybacteria bacterium GW2011_GWB1_36_18]KKR16576.1 MAG: hypothetical protein UT44_C0014G0003 [Candidatus Levybacteria bacterium GW2011_GWA1_39_32]OGH43699.1 MAG: hypothetical protein A3I49_01965 [Candidatus Levybacteria bacterium RIFCSPLOWO2_02_FULL_37_11]